MLQKPGTFGPKVAQAWYHLGLTYYQVRHFEDALKSYTSAVEVDPGYYSAWGVSA